MASSNSLNFSPFFLVLLFSTLRPIVTGKVVSEIKKNEGKEEPYVGVNIGTDISNLLSPSDLVSFLQFQKITHIRLYDADPDILRALARTKIRVIIGVPNNQLIAIGSSNATAATWITRNVVGFYPETLIIAIAVGDEVLTTIPSTSPLLLPAMESLYSALVASNLHNDVKVSTPHSASLILDPFPPSQAFFNTSMTQYMLPIVEFLSRTESPLMMNLYPYYVFMENNGVVPLDNALFKPLTPSKEMVDPNTLLHYTSVYDAMIDSAYFSLRNLNVTDVVVLVTETGWPSKGDSKEPYATVDNADTYNSNLIKHVYDHTGTPFHPEITSSVYIYELFNEDLRSSPLSEANWGLFYGNTTPVYLLHISGSGTFLANDTTNQTYCIAMVGVDPKILQAALDWACGPGRANCSEIQPGESCYEPNNVQNHASYAFDSYYQKEGKASGSCDFKGVAVITASDPSHGSCIFPGRKAAKNNPRNDVNSTQITNGSVTNPSRSRMGFVDSGVLSLCTLVFLCYMFDSNRGRELAGIHDLDGQQNIEAEEASGSFGGSTTSGSSVSSGGGGGISSGGISSGGSGGSSSSGVGGSSNSGSSMSGHVSSSGTSSVSGGGKFGFSSGGGIGGGFGGGAQIGFGNGGAGAVRGGVGPTFGLGGAGAARGGVGPTFGSGGAGAAHGGVGPTFGSGTNP